MTTFEERVIDELRAESELVPRANPAPLPQPTPRWPKFLATAAAILTVIVGSWWVINRSPAPTASSVTVLSVSGDAETEVVDLWVAWWEAWTEVRQNARVFPEPDTTSGDPIGNPIGEHNPQPLRRLAADFAPVTEAASLIFTSDPNRGFVGVGAPTEIRLTPDVALEDGRATIHDCVYMDPILWPQLQLSESSAGTAQFAAEMERTPDGWKVTQFEPAELDDQFTNGPCRQGHD